MSTSYPDTIIFDPVQSGFYDQEASETYMPGGRLMNYLPHVDGFLLKAGSLQSNSTNLVLTRNGKGDWSLNRTAAAAETYYVRATLDDILRNGETYNYGEFSANPSNQTNGPSAGPKGIAVLNFFAVTNIGVVALTSATLRLGKSVYPISGAAAAAPVQTDLVAATAIATATNGAGDYLTNQVAGPSPTVFSTDDLGLVEIELEVVMADTGTIQIAGIGCHVQFNYD